MATLHTMTKGEQDEDFGTGSGFGRVVLILTGVSALVACLLTILSTFLQAKNYRKPLLQRHVIRILMMVPIFSIASWASLTSLRAAFWIDPFRDVYEAFTLYTFFQLLVNFLGGERALIILMHGRPPVSHFWPLDRIPGVQKVDISDPHTFLSIKRGILQYTWIKPILAVATIAMKATGTFHEGIISWKSGYFWTSLIYNISIAWSLYDLALFWVCMSDDLQPFRPMPKFLCIKGIIFASWWQGFFLSLLVWLGAIPSIGGGYTADNLAAAIQDALICFEMPAFAIWHWYAFSWKDYADRTISNARMPMRFALRDAFGPRDLIEDAKETWSGHKYDYRYFDAEDNVMAHEESASRQARMAEGMRYERGGRGKYWIPATGGENTKQPLLSRWADSHARTMSPGGGNSRSRSQGKGKGYGTNNEPEEPELDPEEERLYTNAKALEFGDWNYPVVNVHYATQEDRLYASPRMVTGSTNRNLLQPTKENRQRRKSRIQSIQADAQQQYEPESSSSHRGSGSSAASSTLMSKGKERLKAVLAGGDLVDESDPKARPDQLMDLVVEDNEAEDLERIRARKEGGAGWNSVDIKHFVKADADEGESEVVRQGFNPDRPEIEVTNEAHTLDVDPGGTAVEESEDELGQKQPYEERRYGDFDEEREVWGGRD